MDALLEEYRKKTLKGNKQKRVIGPEVTMTLNPSHSVAEMQRSGTIRQRELNFSPNSQQLE
jgi:hypothetical protein